jgi:hypothetical protein
MKRASKSLGCIGLFVSLAVFAQAAGNTWTGKICDSAGNHTVRFTGAKNAS